MIEQFEIIIEQVGEHISFLEGFQRSSNVSMAYLLERMGDQTFIEYLRKFGFGEKTGIDLPNEASGIILDTYPIERLTTVLWSRFNGDANSDDPSCNSNCK